MKERMPFATKAILAAVALLFAFQLIEKAMAADDYTRTTEQRLDAMENAVIGCLNRTGFIMGGVMYICNAQEVK